PGAGAARRFSGRLVMRGAEQPEVFRTEKPIERGRAPPHRAGELEQASRALAELQERPARVGEQRANQSAEIGLVAHDGHAASRARFWRATWDRSGASPSPGVRRRYVPSGNSPRTLTVSCRMGCRMSPTIRPWSDASSIGKSVSIRRQKLRGIQSALARKTSGLPPFSK